MAKRVYGIYPTADEALMDVDFLLDNGAPMGDLLILTGGYDYDVLTDAGVDVMEYGSDRISLWDRIKRFFGSDDSTDFEMYFDDLDAGKTILLVEEDYVIPQLDTTAQVEDDYLVAQDARPSGLNTNYNYKDVEDGHIRLAEERLRINKEQVQRGEVTLKKRIVENQETFTVPVAHEELVIEEVTPSDRAFDAYADAFEEETFTVPLMQEEVHVEKVPVVTAEYQVRKETVEGYQEVSDTVRREELDEIDEHGNVLTGSPNKRI